MVSVTPHTYCNYCGTALNAAYKAQAEKHCQRCGQVTYLNPIPVAVILVPQWIRAGVPGIYMVRRGIEPRKGFYALPGGFILEGETWKTAGARELKEELQIDISDPENNIGTFDVISNPQGTRVLVFGIAKTMGSSIRVNEFTASEEALERKIFQKHDIEREEIAFPSHKDMLIKFFSDYF